MTKLYFVVVCVSQRKPLSKVRRSVPAPLRRSAPPPSFFNASLRLQREANNLKRQRLQVEKKRNAVLEGISNEIALFRSAYCAVHGVMVSSVENEQWRLRLKHRTPVAFNCSCQLCSVQLAFTLTSLYISSISYKLVCHCNIHCESKKLGHFFTAYNFRNIEQIFTKFGINHVLFMLNIMPDFDLCQIW